MTTQSNTQDQNLVDTLPSTAPLLSIDPADSDGLKKLAFEEAGSHKGEPESLKNHINIIKEQHIKRVTEDISFQQQAKADVQKELTMMEEEAVGLQSQKNNFEQHQIPLQEQKIEEKNKEIRQLQKEMDENTLQSEFEPIRFWTYVVLVSFLSIYLLFFYASAINAAFFRDMSKVIDSASQDSIGLLLNSIFDVNAIFTWSPALLFVYLGTFMFFAFGTIPHVVAHGKQNRKTIKIVGAILFSFIVDAMIAYKIDAGIHQARILMNMNEDWAWYRSINFYLVLAFGFGAYMVWGFLYETLIEEKKKRDPQNAAKNLMTQLKKELEDMKEFLSKLKLDLQQILGQIDVIEAKIKAKKEELNKQFINKKGLMLSVESFYNGWLLYVNHSPNRTSIESRCREVFQNFKNETELNYN